jgi:hypothetical protein
MLYSSLAPAGDMTKELPPLGYPQQCPVKTTLRHDERVFEGSHKKFCSLNVICLQQYPLSFIPYPWVLPFYVFCPSYTSIPTHRCRTPLARRPKSSSAALLFSPSTAPLAARRPGRCSLRQSTSSSATPDLATLPPDLGAGGHVGRAMLGPA